MNGKIGSTLLPSSEYITLVHILGSTLACTQESPAAKPCIHTATKRVQSNPTPPFPSLPLSSFLLSPPLSSPPFPFPSLHPAPADDTRLVEAQEALLKRQVENEDLKQQIEFLNSVISDLQVGCSVQLCWQYSPMPCCALPVSNYCLTCYCSASWKPLKCLPWGSTLRTVLTAGGPDVTCTQCMYCMYIAAFCAVLYGCRVSLHWCTATWVSWTTRSMSLKHSSHFIRLQNILICRSSAVLASLVLTTILHLLSCFVSAISSSLP